MNETTKKRWEKIYLTDEQRAEIRSAPRIAIRDDYSRLALCWADVDADAIIAAHNADAALRETVEAWLNAPTGYDRPRLDRLHDDRCTRYQKGLHFTTNDDCDCSLRPVIDALRSPATGEP